MSARLRCEWRVKFIFLSCLLQTPPPETDDDQVREHVCLRFVSRSACMYVRCLSLSCLLQPAQRRRLEGEGSVLQLTPPSQQVVLLTAPAAAASQILSPEPVSCHRLPLSLLARLPLSSMYLLGTHLPPATPPRFIGIGCIFEQPGGGTRAHGKPHVLACLLARLLRPPYMDYAHMASLTCLLAQATIYGLCTTNVGNISKLELEQRLIELQRQAKKVR